MSHRSPSTVGDRRRGGGDGDTTALFERDSSAVLQLGRHTPSAIPRQRQARGFDGIVATFSKPKQLAVRQLCLERLDIEQRIELFKQRLSQMEQSDRKPAALFDLEEQHQDNTYRLRKIAGAAFGTLLALLEDPELREALSPEVQFEEEMDNGRLFRRRLVHNNSAKPISGYRNTNHDHPTSRGYKQAWDSLNSADPDAGASYYERQQLKYGRARRGSTSIAGAWEEVFKDSSAQQQPGAIQDSAGVSHGTGPAGNGADKHVADKHVANKNDEKPSKAAAEAATKKAQQLSSPGHRILTPAESAQTDGKEGEDLNDLISEAQQLVSSYHNEGTASSSPTGRRQNDVNANTDKSRSSPQNAAHASSSAVNPATRSNDQAGNTSAPNSTSVAVSPNGSEGEKKPSGRQTEVSFHQSSNRRINASRADDTVSHQGSRLTRATDATESFRLPESTSVLPPVRTTPSAHALRNRSRGLQALIASHNLREQHMIRELACDYLEVLIRYESVVERNQDDDRSSPRVKSEVTELLEEAMRERKEALKKAVGEDEASVILSHLTDPDVRQELGFQPESEDMHATDEAMRIWRRRLLRMHQLKKAHGGYSILHDSPTGNGVRQTWNQLNSEDSREGLSYYQRQQLRYGRGRRGSTSVAGAWETVFNDAEHDASSEEESVVKIYSAEEEGNGGARAGTRLKTEELTYDDNVRLVEEAMHAARSGNEQQMYEAATRLANALKRIREGRYAS
eukprot:gb/GECG01011882.1/.p1 GENE.gb/GECG01011882.1/~~gb/GECG01011882.1/.p1  ORF type:complete len:739 (+),score=107.89 gb/GECG01011882.1/:1-2217(+)